MRKSVLALSIATMIGGLGLAGVASARVFAGSSTLTPATMTQTTANNLVVSEGGVGHMLLVPYYTAQNDNMTVLHVVNTDTVNGKAIKVRFRGAANSDDVFDFQVFMSPGDVWTAQVTKNASTGIAELQTDDTTCSVPSLGVKKPNPFNTQRLRAADSAERKANGTREGYVEIFNMADISGAQIYGSGANAHSALYNAIKHASDVAPCSIAGSAARTTLNGIALTDFTNESQAAAAGFDTPSSGLMGDWYIINVPQTTTFAGGATAVTAVDTRDNAPASPRGNFVHFPQINTPVSVGNAQDWSADPLFTTIDFTVTGGTTPYLSAGMYDFPDMSTPYTTSSPTQPDLQAALLTEALARTSVTNQYALDAVIEAKTDWTFSMPTRRYHVAANYKVAPANTSAYKIFSDNDSGWFRNENTNVITDATDNGYGNICVVTDGQRFWNREESTTGAQVQEPVFSPANPPGVTSVQLCGEASVLAFKDAGSSVLAATVARTTQLDQIYENGWGVVDTNNGGRGLPVLGSSFIKLVNPGVKTVDGVTYGGTYGITWPHRYVRATLTN